MLDEIRWIEPSGAVERGGRARQLRVLGGTRPAGREMRHDPFTIVRASFVAPSLELLAGEMRHEPPPSRNARPATSASRDCSWRSASLVLRVPRIPATR